MSGGWILAIDQGTSNTKALLVGRDGQPAYRASAAVGISSPHPGWVEQDALALWQSVLDVIAECLRWVTQQGGRIEGVAISNQRETVVAWQRATSRPVGPAISWQCRRSAAICEQLKANGQEAMLREHTGLAIDPLFSASKMRWLLENVPGLRERTERGEIAFGTVDSWLIWMLTDGRVHACDVSNASRTQLLNLTAADWDGELLQLFGVPRAVLPKAMPSGAVYGECAVEGLRGVPIVSAMGDSHAAMAGHASFALGTVKATYGTGSSLMTLSPGVPSMCESSKLAGTIAWGVSGGGVQYALEGNVSMSGAAVQWVGEFLGLADPVNDTVALAAMAQSSGGVYFVPAMLGLGAPHWDSAARGTIVGLERSSRSSHLALASLEAIAFQVRDVFEAAAEQAGCDLPVLHADGGATRNDQLMQMQADVLGRPVVRSGHQDLSALGAAWFGGLALGWWPSLTSLSGLVSATTTFYPEMAEDEREQRYAGWKLAVKRARLQETHA